MRAKPLKEKKERKKTDSTVNAFTAKSKRQKEENGLVINFSSLFTFAFSRDVNKNWLFSNVVKYVRDRMLQYDGFYYARHETIDAGDVKAQTSQKPTR